MISEKNHGGVDDEKKRSLLKTAGATVAGSTILPSLLGTATGEETQINVSMYDDETWTMGEKAQEDHYYSASYDERWAIGSSLHTYGGCPDDTGKWSVTYDIDGSAGVKRYPYDQQPSDGFFVDRIGKQKVSVFEPYETGDDEEVYFTNDKDKSAVWPAPDSDWAEVAETAFTNVAEIAIGEINPILGGMKAAGEVFNEMLHEFNIINETKGESYEVGYDYSQWDLQSEVNQYAQWKHTLNYDDDTVHYAENYMASDGAGVECSVNWKITTHAPSSDTCSSSTGTMSTQSCTTDSRSNKPDWITDISKAPKDFKKKYGLQKVPIPVLEKVGFERDDLQIVDGNKAWWAANIPTKAEVVPRSETPSR